MITVPLYVVVGQATLLLVACYVLAAAYRRIGTPAHAHDHPDPAADLAGRALPELGDVVAPGGAVVAAPRAPGPGTPAVLLYVLPGCEGCLTALTNLHAAVTGRSPYDQPAVHVLSVGTDSGLDRYERFGFPVWRTTRDLEDLFEVSVYPVFLAVDAAGMIATAGSVHHDQAVRTYLMAAQTTDRRLEHVDDAPRG